jgi:ankyrin repeat protein
VRILNAEGAGPLNVIAGFGHIDLIRLYIQLGADVNTRDINGRTPLKEAIDDWHDDAAEVLREYGATL